MYIQFLTDESLESVVGGDGKGPANGQLWASDQGPANDRAPVNDISNKHQLADIALGFLFG